MGLGKGKLWPAGCKGLTSPSGGPNDLPSPGSGAAGPSLASAGHWDEVPEMRGGEVASAAVKPPGPEVVSLGGSQEHRPPGETQLPKACPPGETRLPGRSPPGSRNPPPGWPPLWFWVGVPRPSASGSAQGPRGPLPSHFPSSILKSGFWPPFPLLWVPQTTLGRLKAPSCCPRSLPY